VNRPLSKMAVSAGVVLASAALLAGIAGPASAAGASRVGHHRHDSKAWSFGVMADTQWIGADDGKNPNSVAVDIIRQLNAQFIQKRVKFVVQAGDLVDSQSTASLDTTAAFRQELYNAGIGFYPLRGNHEASAASATEFLRVFPQTQTALMNSTPADALAVTNPDAATQPAPTASGSPFQVGTISASPAAPAGFGGLCYAVDYKNARIVLLDQFTPTTGASHSTLDSAQVDWMNAQLAGRPAGTHAFVFGHKGIITENHVDTLFGANPTVTPSLQNAFITGLQAGGVRYYMGGHDHIHNRAIVKSVDGASGVEDITLASDSSKFYIPFGSAGYVKRAVDSTTKAVTANGTLAAADPTQTNDNIYDVQVAGGSARETEVAQELNTIGYYVYTVRGPKVRVDYYSAAVNPTLSSGEYLLSTTPAMTFTKRESYGYSLNGKEFQVPEGQSYASVSDSFAGTTARILGGVNGSKATDAAGRTLTKTVDTGWNREADRCDLSSNVLTLWGMEDIGSKTTDTYALSMSYDLGHRDGPGILVARDGKDGWVNAVEQNASGHARFVEGPWKASYALGTYGIDPHARTAWAVVDHDGTFAVAHHVHRHVSSR